MSKHIPLTRKITLTDKCGRQRIETEAIVDTGSAVSLIIYNLVSKFDIKHEANLPQLRGAFNGHVNEILGKTTLFLTLDGIRQPIEFLVIATAQFKCIIGWPAIQQLGLQLSYEGIFTRERRIFGKTASNSIKLVNSIRKEDVVKVYNINISKNTGFSAINLGGGVFEEASSGLVYTTFAQKPSLTHNFLASPDLVATPTEKPTLHKESILRNIREAFEQNKFEIDESIPASFKGRIQALILENYECISLSKEEIGNVPSWIDEFRQEFITEEPVPCQIFNVNPVKAKFLSEELSKLVKMKVLREVKARTVTSKVLAVPKKCGELRMVSDLRVTNKHTKPANLILPRLDQIAQKLMGHKYYVSFDVQKAYWSVTVPEDQRKWFTLQCPQTHKVYEWVKMPMGAKNAASVFTHLLQIHLVNDLNDVVTVYIDDVNYGINDLEQGYQILKKLLERLKKLNLKIGMNKIKLFTTELVAFGVKFDLDGMKPTDKRIKALLEQKVPIDKKGLHRALASLNYFRSFIPGFSAKAARMYGLIGDKATYNQEVVNKDWPTLIRATSEVIKIQVPDFTKPMILSTDASEYGLGMVLTQEASDGGRKIIGCHSQGLGKSEKLWAIAQKELVGIYKGLVHFEHLIFNNLVIIETDNNSIYWILKLRIGSIEINRRLPAVRHLLYISSFNYEIRHVSGQEPSFLLSDFLSRNNYELGEQSHFVLGRTSKEPLLQLKAIINGKYDTVPVNVVEFGDSPTDRVLSAHKLEKPAEEIKKLIGLAQSESKFCKTMIENPKGMYKAVDGILFRATVHGLYIVCPRFYTKQVLSYLHDDTHESVRTTINKINANQIWLFRKYYSVASYIQNCKKCDPARSRACLKAENRTVNRPWKPFDVVGVDLMNIGKIFVVVLVDHFSDFIVCRVLKDGTSEEIKPALADIFCHYGIPHTLVQDNGGNLNSAVMMQFYDNLGIYVSRSSVNNSRGNNRSEAAVGRLSSRLRIFGSDNGNLQLNLYIIAHKLNLEKRPGKRHTAFEIMFARKGSWVLQLPELSQARYYAQDKSLKMLFDSANEIRDEMMKVIEKRRENIQKVPEINNISKGDRVRIRKFAVDAIKKEFRPFSETTWEVVSVNRFTNTCLLKEISEPGYQPRIRRVHKRFLRRIRKPIEGWSDDFVPDTPNDMVGHAVKPKAVDNDQQGNEKSDQDKKEDPQREELKTRNQFKSEFGEKKTPRIHKMTLRTRKNN